MGDIYKMTSGKYIRTEENINNLKKNYNNNPNYGMKNKHHTEETKTKMSKEGKKRIGIFNGFYGKHHSKETKEKLRKFHLGKKLNEETKIKISIGNKGKKNTEETKRKMSKSKKGKHNLKQIASLKKFYKTEKGIIRRKKISEIIKKSRAKQIFPIKDTSIEVKIQKFLTQLQIEYFTHKYMHIEHDYQCDIFIPVQKGIMQKTIIECDGDYWHGNPLLYKEGKLNEKQKQQQRKDNIRTQELIKKDFRVIRLWETEINNMKCYDLNNKIII